MVAVRFLVPLLLVVSLALCEDKTDASTRPKKDIGLKIREALAASEQDSSWNHLGSNLDFSYQQPSYFSSFGYQQPSYAGSFGYQLPSYSSSYDYQQPSYGSSFAYQPQISTSDSPLTYHYKYYNKYYYPTAGLGHHTYPQTYSHFSTPQFYGQNYYSLPSYSSHALLQPYGGSYAQSYPDSSSLYSGNPTSSYGYQQPLTSSYAGSNYQQSLSDNSYQQSYQSYPSASHQSYPANSDYSFDNKADNSYLSSSQSNSGLK